MPVYQYACTECGEQLEVRQSFTEAALTECPACAGRLRKVLNAVGVVFKGSGFYRNDSRVAANGDSKGSGSSDGSAAKTSESTPTTGGSEKKSEGSSGKKASSTGSSDSNTGSKPAPATTH